MQYIHCIGKMTLSLKKYYNQLKKDLNSSLKNTTKIFDAMNLLKLN